MSGAPPHNEVTRGRRAVSRERGEDSWALTTVRTAPAGVHQLCSKPRVQQEARPSSRSQAPGGQLLVLTLAGSGKTLASVLSAPTAVTQGDRAAEEGEFLRVESQPTNEEAVMRFAWRRFPPPGGFRGPSEDGPWPAGGGANAPEGRQPWW